MRASWGLLWVLRDLQRPTKVCLGPKLGPGCKEKVLYEEKEHDNCDTNSLGLTGSNCDQIWPLRAVRGLQRVQRGCFRVNRVLLRGHRSTVKVKLKAKVNDLHVAHPGTLCGSVLDIDQTVWVIPKFFRGPKVQ